MHLFVLYPKTKKESRCQGQILFSLKKSVNNDWRTKATAKIIMKVPPFFSLYQCGKILRCKKNCPAGALLLVRIG